MSKFIYSLAVIGFGLLLGVGIQFLAGRGLIRLPLPIDRLRRRLQQAALLGLNPVAVVGAIWAIRSRDTTLALLPFIGVFALLAGGVLAAAAARFMNLPPRRAGAMFGCGSFTNIGSIGALVCFVFLGEAGFALVPIYKLFEEFFYYAIGFPIAKFYSHRAAADEGLLARLTHLALDPFILTALAAILLGAGLNVSGVTRPAAFATLNAVLVPLATLMLLCSIGLALRFRRVRDYMRECAVVAAIKFLFVPAAVTTLAWWVGLGQIQDGLPLKVVILLSAMPVAFNALIPPSIYDLDLDLANSCWFATTFLLVLVLPVLLVVIQGV
jgi:predicted permease